MSMEMAEALGEQLKKLAQTDIRSVDPDDLVDIETVKIRPDLSDRERVLDYIQQINNPYCYRYHDMVVKVSFSGTRKLEDCMKECLFTNI